MITDFLLALGMILSPASQLRPAGSAVGPGEICIAIWLGLTLLRNIPRFNRLRITPAVLNIAVFWLVLAAALCIGTLMAFATGQHNAPDKAWHDIQAYIFVAVISLLCVIDPMANVRLPRVGWSLVSIGTVLLLLQLAHGWGMFSISGIDPWEHDRLRGWSSNPNQLALACAVVGFIALHLAETAHSRRSRILALIFAILPFVVGPMTKSDSFLLVLAFAIPGLLVLKIRKSFETNKPQLGIGRATSIMAVATFPVLLILALPGIHVILGTSQDVQRQFIQTNQVAIERDAPIRFEMWGRAVEIGLRSGMLGLGPGAHLERRRRTQTEGGSEGKIIQHFSVDPKPGFETHNTILELFTQGGLLAVVAFVWLSAKTILTTLRWRLDALSVLLCSLLVFSLFHHVIRHPLLWFVIVWCLATTLYTAGRSAAAKS